MSSFYEVSGSWIVTEIVDNEIVQSVLFPLSKKASAMEFAIKLVLEHNAEGFANVHLAIDIHDILTDFGNYQNGDYSVHINTVTIGDSL